MDHTISGSFGAISIQPLRLGEIETLRLIRNREEIRACFFCSSIISAEEQQTWYAGYLKEPNDYMFSIFSKKTGDWIGAAALYNVDEAKGQAEFGRLLITPDCKERGLGKATVRGVCSIGFAQLGLGSIYLEVFEANRPAFTCYTHVGFHTVCRSERNGYQTLLMKLSRDCFNPAIADD